MIDEKKIPQRIYIKDSQLAECEIEGVADARINAVPYKGGRGKLCEYINIDFLWHDASEMPIMSEHSMIIVELNDITACKYSLWRSTTTYECLCNNKGYVRRWLYLDDLLKEGGEK